MVLIDENHEIKELAITHKDSEKVVLTKDLYNSYIGNPKSTHGVKKILQTGKSELISYVDAKALAPIRNDPKLLKIVESLNLQSYMGVPLTVRNETIGAITFSSAHEDRHYTKQDLLFAEEI